MHCVVLVGVCWWVRWGTRGRLALCASKRGAARLQPTPPCQALRGWPLPGEQNHAPPSMPQAFRVDMPLPPCCRHLQSPWCMPRASRTLSCCPWPSTTCAPGQWHSQPSWPPWSRKRVGGGGGRWQGASAGMAVLSSASDHGGLVVASKKLGIQALAVPAGFCCIQDREEVVGMPARALPPRTLQAC